ncbi:hypothetical protein ACVWZV_002197 [Bradyrhizobium sp. GM5.1]
MEPVNSYEDVVYLEKRKQIVAVFVASGLDTDAVKWVFDTWFELGRRSGDRWHVVVPLKRMPLDENDTSVLVPNNFNVELAEQMRNVYGVTDAETPVLVFDDFNDEARQMMVSLNDKEGRKDVILAIERFMKQEMPDGVQLSDTDRQNMTAKLVRRLQAENIKQSAFTFAANTGSALSKIAFQAAFKAAAHAAGIPLP